ncbi:MAG: hypothetical protein JWN98_1850, partial [Abditibacteriota bacterium]|nr:hypothetical protein [Abditibacteriota bacterium]
IGHNADGTPMLTLFGTAQLSEQTVLLREMGL